MTDIFRTAGLELDLNRFQVRRGGATVPVQPQVFDVLCYLVTHRDRIVSKDELLDQVWNGRYISETTLSSRIKAVRQLIGDSGKRQALLQTIRHRGFRYVAPVTSEPAPADARAPAAPAAARAAAGEPRTGIAVLPFEMTGEDDRRVYLGEGIAADIISLLARHQWLRVIARGTSFSAAVAARPPQEIATLLGIDYILTGRIRRLDDRMRIDAELTDGASGRLLWSEAYNAAHASLFVVQEEMAEQIAAAIEGRLGQFERQKIQGKRPEDFDAWDSCHKGFWHLYRFTEHDLETAKTWFRTALTYDPDLPRAHSGLACAGVQLAFYGAPESRPAELETALESAQRAVALDPWDAFNRYALGRALCLVQRLPEARAELEEAIAANHSFAQAYFALAFCHTVWDEPAAAFPLYEKATRLSPHDPHLWTFHHMRGMAHFRLGQHDEAERHVRAAVRQPNATYWPFATLAALLGVRGRVDAAAAIAHRLRQMKPAYDLAYARQDFFFMRDAAFIDRYVDGLSAAGVPHAA